MDNRKENLSGQKLCRFCLTSDDELIPLYSNKTKAPKNSVPFTLKILSCIAIEVFPSDGMPKYICQRCKFFMEISYNFKQMCRQADETILQYVQNGSPLAAMPWNAQLTKAYKACSKQDGSMVQTVTQGGTTVKVMAEECSDSEEGDDDNVYSVKIGDGSEEGKSIKVITSVNKAANTGAKGRQLNIKNMEEEEGSETGGQRCWPCDECEGTYPLEQLLTLHKMQKHNRKRNEICKECGKRFFSKDNLETHQETHSPKWMFHCVACGKIFRRLILLKRHEKTMHSDLPQLQCMRCPSSFLSPEELEGHQLKHASNKTRPYSCFCGKRFPSKKILERHKVMVHDNKAAFSCDYCPEQFASVSKLTRHVREHAGEKPYPCKYCDKSFTKSHHYTRHLRHKHTSTITANPYREAFRCGSCPEQFPTQDELMYHSALHATRNLTCPLCQEKFEDVDTVTAHIKSHVNGSEFMCDFCELMFTQKEKLDAHLTKAHEEEMQAADQETELDESSMDLDAEDDDEEDTSLDVKEQNGEMVVEIKKPDEYLLPAQPDDDKADNTQSEDSEVNDTDTLNTDSETIPVVTKLPEVPSSDVSLTKVNVTPAKVMVVPKNDAVDPSPIKSSPILRKAEDVKRKVMVLQQKSEEKKDKPKVESSAGSSAASAGSSAASAGSSAASAGSSAASAGSSVASAGSSVASTGSSGASAASSGASDKSLRLLEKELQDLKRTNSRGEAAKTPARAPDALRNRRAQMFASTPKPRTVEKKEPVQKPTPDKIVDKKQPERKVISKEVKEKSNNNTSKDDRELKGAKDDKDAKGKEEVRKEETKVAKEEKEPKGSKDEEQKKKESAKNGASETPTTSSEDVSVRRSTRPSKVKDYAKMIRDSSMNSDEEDTDFEDFEEDLEEEKSPEVSQSRGRGRRISNKAVTPGPKPGTPASKLDTPATAPRKRGRPRKEPKIEVPSKMKKEERQVGGVARDDGPSQNDDAPKENQPANSADGPKTPESNTESEPRPGVIISPSGQALKKVQVKSLPPGVKALPLLGKPTSEVTEMQIGKKIMKVQKIVMTKAEVEAMTKKGLLEMRDGTMVLKQGIKLPAADITGALKASLATD